MAFKNIILKKQDGIATITINRPDALNALNKDTIHELTDAFEDIESDKKIKAAILTGSGDKAFIAGADIKQMKDLSPIEAKDFSEIGHNLIFRIENLKIPVIAAVNGYALGGGCEVMMGCDIVIASDNALIGQPEINLGISPGFGGTQRLTRIIGKYKAKELLLTGDNISAKKAEEIGLVNSVVEKDKLMKIVEKIAKKIASKSKVQINYIKELINKGVEIDLTSACALEISYFSSSFSTHDQKEGMNAFVEKRKPNFKDK